MDHQTFKISVFSSSLLLGVSSIASTAVYKEALSQVDWQAREQELTSLFLPRNFSAQYGLTSDSLLDLLTYPIDKEISRSGSQAQTNIFIMFSRYWLTFSR